MAIGRREFLSTAGLAGLSLASGEMTLRDLIDAPQTPPKALVGVIGSNFGGLHDANGTAVSGLVDPRPLDSALTDSQLDAMVRKAFEAATTSADGLTHIVKPNDWVVIKPNIVLCPGVSEVMQVNWIPGMVADPRVVRSLIAWLVESRCGRRFTIAEASGGWKCLDHSKEKTDGWTTTWNGVFGGFSYKEMIADFSRRYPSLRFDTLDLNFDNVIEVAVPGGALASGNPAGKYFIPRTVLKCDRLISVAAMKTNPVGASLSIKNYFGIGPGSFYGFPKLKLHEFGDPSEVMVDLLSFHPADYALVGGCFGVEGDGQQNVRHNVIVAGANAVAVDAVAAAVMGFSPAELLFLRNASKKGFGTHDLNQIHARGNSLAEVRRKFVPDPDWHPA